MKNLQNHYVVERDGQRVGVPVEQLTDAEYQALIEKYQAMGDALTKHEAEILAPR